MKTLNIRKMGGAAKQAGFTIIELVVVILLLGILTATALPRFVDVTDEAHAAAVDGVLGGFGTGVALFRAQYEGLGRPTSAIVEFGNLFAQFTGTTPGFPGHLATGVFASSADCVEAFTGILQIAGAPLPVVGTDGTSAAGGTGVTASGASTAVDWVAVFAATPVTCEYYYTGNGAAIGQTLVPMITYTPMTGSVLLSTVSLP